MPTILITGATAGLGRDAALHFARQGHRVFATGRNMAALARLQEDAAGLPVETLILDVTDRASVVAARDEVMRRTEDRGLDVLINNAGYGLAGPLEVLSDEDVRAQFDTNVFGLLDVTRAFLPAMRARRAGRIVNVSSLSGRISLPFFGAYHATKFAVESISDTLRQELYGFGIEVVVVEPGKVRSSFEATTMALLQRYDTPDSAYRSVFAQTERYKAWFARTEIEPERVIAVLDRAVNARRPHARYAVPFVSAIGVSLYNLLPTFVQDVLITRILGLTATPT